MQHVELGQALSKVRLGCLCECLLYVFLTGNMCAIASYSQAYQSFIMGLNLQKDIFIRSTHYARTIQSAAGLMIGLLGSDLTSLKGQMPIQTFLWDAMEFMHGSGLRSTSKNTQNENGEQVVVGTCRRSVAYSEAQRAASQPRKEVMNQLAGLFGQGVHNMKMTELTDAIMPSYCHGEPLPCTPQVKIAVVGPRLSAVFTSSSSLLLVFNWQGCVNIELLKEMKRDSDRMYCERFWGDQGGLNATKLSHYQLMDEIATRVRESAAGQSHIKLSLLSGHDTVIAPVLASLGVSTCGWPPCE